MNRRSHAQAGALLLAAGLLLLASGCSTEQESPTYDNPFDPSQGADLPVPQGVLVTVGDNQVQLTWSLAAGREADEYAVFRRRTDAEVEEPEALAGRVAAQSFTDNEVRNGRTYAYRVAAGDGGRFGARTPEAEARPGLFTVVIGDGDEVTRTRSVVVDFDVATAQALQLSEDPQDFAEPWQPAVRAPWTLSAGDGTKTLYARFRLADGAETVPVYDRIRLDTQAAILSLSFDGAAVRQPGEVLHVRMVTGEPDGTARVSATGIFDNQPLRDDGGGGDAVAGDGTYEADLTIPPAASAFQQALRGAFEDQAGNTAPSMSAPQLLTVGRAPDAIELLAAVIAEPPEDAAVTLQWRESQSNAFSAYRLYRSETPPVDSTDRLIGTVRQAGTTAFEDREVAEGSTYSYRVYVVDTQGLETGSNTLSVTLPNTRPPEAVNLQTPSATSTTRIGLAWSRSEARDFQRYRVHRSETGAVSDEDTLAASIDDIERTYWDDGGLRENTTYYYRVFTLDRGGLESRSNEVSGRTANEPPPAVTLSQATAIDSTAATVSWGASTAHDFASYQLYRDEIATVTTGSTLVVELDQTSFTSFRDNGLRPDTRYFYRVFVVDDAPDAASTGSNTITLVTLPGPEGSP